LNGVKEIQFWFWKIFEQLLFYKDSINAHQKKRLYWTAGFIYCNDYVYYNWIKWYAASRMVLLPTCKKYFSRFSHRLLLSFLLWSNGVANYLWSFRKISYCFESCVCKVFPSIPKTTFYFVYDVEFCC
jgi:hypothetical protein